MEKNEAGRAMFRNKARETQRDPSGRQDEDRACRNCCVFVRQWRSVRVGQSIVQTDASTDPCGSRSFAPQDESLSIADV